MMIKPTRGLILLNSYLFFGGGYFYCSSTVVSNVLSVILPAATLHPLHYIRAVFCGQLREKSLVFPNFKFSSDVVFALVFK